ncbi:MAG TPA: TolC family protein [Thermodesulfovibrionales bacterium]|nr:TolC family protein [Thermodesulfovibrionales bacterium]
MKWFFPVLLFFVFSTPFRASADEMIKKDESLNVERCVEIALKMQPSIVAAAGTMRATESRIGQAESNYYPQVNWQSSYSRIKPASSSSGNSSGISGGSPGGSSSSFDQYSAGVNLSQLIYDFGKTPTQVKIQKYNFDSSRSDFASTSEQIIFNVRQAYYGVLQAKRNKDVSTESVRQFQQHLEQAKGFFEVGTKPKFDVTKAEVDLGNAKLNLILAENSVRIALVNLNNSMGVPNAPEYTLEDNLTFQKYSILLGDALSRAFRSRPDLKSAISRRQAAQSAIDLARTGYYPVVTGNAAYNWSGEKFPLEHGWDIGAAVSFPIFSGFLTKYQVQEAKSNLNVLQANEESVRQTVISDVQQAFLNLKAAEERVPTAQLNVEQAQENLDIANGRYAAGVGNPIEVTDAEVSLITAKTSYIQALYDYKVAQASLDKAMGVAAEARQ